MKQGEQNRHWSLDSPDQTASVIILSLFMRIEGGKIVNAINKGHTVTTEDLKGEMPSVLNMIPRCDISFPLFPSCISAKIVSFDSGLIIRSSQFPAVQKI